MASSRASRIRPVKRPSRSPTVSPRGGRAPLVANAPAESGERVLDCVLLEPAEWWIGWHRARAISSRWPGGLFLQPLPEDAISRAYIKLAEALAWSALPLRRGDTAVEIGCALGARARRYWPEGCR